MAVVRVQINGRIYDIACDDGQEDHLRLLADEVDDRVRALLGAAGSSTGEIMALLLTSLTMADELLEHKKAGHATAQPVYQANDEEKRQYEQHLQEMESSMARTLNEIAHRIEAIAQQIEIG